MARTQNDGSNDDSNLDPIETLNDEELNGDDNEENDNALGLDAEGDPSPSAYVSESSAPLSADDRRESRELSGRAQWANANETGDPTGNEVENGPDVDPNDPNLSATLAEAGAEERKNELGMTDIEPFLDDPDADEE